MDPQLKPYYDLAVKLGMSPADANAYASAALAQAQGNSNGKDDPLLFWRYDSAPSSHPTEHGGGQQITPVKIKASEAMADFENWPAIKLNNFIDQAIHAGLLKQGSGYFEAKQLWGQLVSTSVDKTIAGQSMNPFDILSMLGGNGAQAQSSRPPKITTSTNKQVDLSSPAEARQFLNNSLSALLGRAANPGEVDDFITTVNAAERENPSISQTTTHHKYDASGHEINSNSSTVVSGGFTDADRAQMVEDDTMDTPEYASVQAASTYFPLLEQALGAAANVQGR